MLGGLDFTLFKLFCLFDWALWRQKVDLLASVLDIRIIIFVIIVGLRFLEAALALSSLVLSNVETAHQSCYRLLDRTIIWHLPTLKKAIMLHIRTVFIWDRSSLALVDYLNLAWSLIVLKLRLVWVGYVDVNFFLGSLGRLNRIFIVTLVAPLAKVVF